MEQIKGILSARRKGGILLRVDEQYNPNIYDPDFTRVKWQVHEQSSI